MFFVGLTACQELETVPITEAMHFAGQADSTSVETLERGREAYMLYCYGCHGMTGDGNGPASYGLRPAPRDLRLGDYKFAKVLKGLPHDDDFERIIRQGLQGTAMLKWDIPDTPLNDIIQYIKTFAPDRWRIDDKPEEDQEKLGTKLHVVTPWEEDWKKMQEEAGKAGNQGADSDDESSSRCLVMFEEVASEGADADKATVWKDKSWAELVSTFEDWPCVMVRDPYQPAPGSGQDSALLRAEAIELGKKVFHVNQCWQCHPSFVTTDEITAYHKELRPNDPPPVSYRDHLFHSEAKPSDVYTRRPWKAGEECDASIMPDCPEELEDNCRVCQKDELCVSGRCEFKVRIPPPDFLLVDVRSGSTVNELFKTITLGIHGTAMIANLDAYKDNPEQLWALAYYVRSLIDLKGTPTAIAIKDRLLATMPAKTEAAPEQPAPAPAAEQPAPAPAAEQPAPTPAEPAPAEPAPAEPAPAEPAPAEPAPAEPAPAEPAPAEPAPAEPGTTDSAK